MLKTLFKLEDGLLRVERALLVVLVLVMLLLAAYVVFYRNVLVPWQNRLIVSGPPVVRVVEGAAPALPEARKGVETQDSDGNGFAGGFGDSEDETGEDEGFAGGFGGGFGTAGDEAGEGADQHDDDEGFAGGFGGGFGTSDDETDEDEGFAGGFGGGFGDDGAAGAAADDGEAQESTPAPASVTARPAAPVGGPPPQGSMAARIIQVINAIKFSWIDSLLRQLVLICGFLGAMLATRRRNHISIDIFGRFLKGRAAQVCEATTSLAATVVCALLAISGWNLVKIGIEFPQDIIPWVTQWQFQLIFPIGWGLLAVHFLLRALEAAFGVDDAGADGAVAEESASVNAGLTGTSSAGGAP